MGSVGVSIWQMKKMRLRGWVSGLRLDSPKAGSGLGEEDGVQAPGTKVQLPLAEGLMLPHHTPRGQTLSWPLSCPKPCAPQPLLGPCKVKGTLWQLDSQASGHPAPVCDGGAFASQHLGVCP